MTRFDNNTVRIVSAKVHGDSGTSAVAAERKGDEAEDIEASEDADVRRLEALDRQEAKRRP